MTEEESFVIVLAFTGKEAEVQHNRRAPAVEHVAEATLNLRKVAKELRLCGVLLT